LGPEWKSGNWLGGVGLVLAGFGGHAVVPGLARDMKHPGDFEKVINRAFVSHSHELRSDGRDKERYGIDDRLLRLFYRL
jgi:hypothetical protein